MEKLKEKFRKKGIDYRLLNRTDKYALYEQAMEGEVIGYEVCRIRFNKAWESFGKCFPESESLPSDEQFGMDGTIDTRSKQYFVQDLGLAEKYLHQVRP